MTRLHPTRLILVRHGQSVANAERRVQGWADAPLSELGQQQTRLLARWLQHNETHINCLVSSPLQRAHQTASHIAEVLRLPVRTHSGLRELGLGALEDHPEEALQAALQAGDIVVSHHAEPMSIFGERVVTALDEIVAAARGQTILVTAHLGVIAVALAHWLHGDIELAWQKYGRIPNTSMSELLIHEQAELIRHGAVPHLAHERGTAS